MHRGLRSFLLVFLTVALLSACNKIPDHARYIPKDAIATGGINLKALGKKIAWNVISGSKLFKEMQDRIAEKNSKEVISGLDKAGIDFSNTIYIYAVKDNRFIGGNRITGLVPLSDAGQWESYVKLAFPHAEVKQVGSHKEAGLGRDMYVGWTSNLMIVINTMPGNADMAAGGFGPRGNTLDMATVSAEMDKAFKVPDGGSIIDNKHFTTLEMEGHDMTFMLNYEQLMTQMSSDMAQKVGISLSDSLWKDAAFTTGFDFVKGKITGDMKYFLSPKLSEAGAILGGTNTDNDMLDRLPNQNIDMLLGMHLAPKGIKILMEKMNLLGLANAGLSTQHLNLDNVLNAFTGDMAIVMNDFSLHTETVTDSFMGQNIVHKNQKPSVNLTYAIKMNNKEDFQKILQLAKDNGLPAMGNGFVIPIDERDSVYIMMDDKYMVASNNLANTTGYLQGAFASKKMPDAAASQVYGHPASFFLDMQQLLKNIDPSVSGSPHDSAMIAESKKLLSTIYFNGGAFKDNAFEYHLDINFMNTGENSIINLMDYCMKMSDADKIKGNTVTGN